MNIQNYTFFTFRGDYGIIDDRRKRMCIYNKLENRWELVDHYSVTVFEKDLEEIPYDSSLSDLLKNYKDYLEKLEEIKKHFSAK